MTYEVSAAAKPPQTTPLYIGTRVDTREGNGECRRWRDSGRCAHLDRQNGTNDSRNGKAAQWRGSGNTRRSLPACRHECLSRVVVCGAFAAADTSYVIVRASFASIHHWNQPLSFHWRPKSLAQSAQSDSHFRSCVIDQRSYRMVWAWCRVA